MKSFTKSGFFIAQFHLLDPDPQNCQKVKRTSFYLKIRNQSINISEDLASLEKVEKFHNRRYRYLSTGPVLRYRYRENEPC